MEPHQACLVKGPGTAASVPWEPGLPSWPLASCLPSPFLRTLLDIHPWEGRGLVGVTKLGQNLPEPSRSWSSLLTFIPFCHLDIKGFQAVQTHYGASQPRDARTFEGCPCLTSSHSRENPDWAPKRDLLCWDISQVDRVRNWIGPRTLPLFSVTVLPSRSALKRDRCERFRKTPAQNPSHPQYHGLNWLFTLWAHARIILDCFQIKRCQELSPPQAKWIRLSGLGPGHWYF